MIVIGKLLCAPRVWLSRQVPVQGAQASYVAESKTPSFRAFVPSDDLSRGQCVGTQFGADRSTRCGVIQRQLNDFDRVYGDLVVVRVVADWRARTAILRKPEIVAPLARACGQVPRAFAAGAGRQAMHRRWNIEHRPMPPATASPRIGIVNRHRKALRAGRLA